MHIAGAPDGGVCETIMESTEVEIKTADDSHPPVKAKLVDLTRMPLYQLSNVFTFQSHGLTAAEFTEQYQEANPHASFISPIAVYYYKAISNQ